MKVRQLIGERLKERPSDCQAESHALMIRGGYLKQAANGIFSQYPPLRRICQKIECIIREEMDAIGGQEVQFPVVLPPRFGKNPDGMKALAGNSCGFPTVPAPLWCWP